jgi:hypothetical protein
MSNGFYNKRIGVDWRSWSVYAAKFIDSRSTRSLAIHALLNLQGEGNWTYGMSIYAESKSSFLGDKRLPGKNPRFLHEEIRDFT